jgi:hypothetical protein
MSLKLFTTICLVVGMLLFLPYAGMLAHPPTTGTSKVERRAYVEKLFLLNGLQLVCLIGAGVGATLVVKKARRDFREEAVQNMKRLVEGEE